MLVTAGGVGVDANGIQWLEPRDAAKHSALHRRGPLLPTKNHPVGKATALRLRKLVYKNDPQRH